MQKVSQTIKSVLNELPKGTGNYKAVIGLDGFVDKIQRPVRTQDKGVSNYYDSLDSFGQRIREASTRSAQIELHTTTIKLGGNAPIFANALARLGISNICLGTFGAPQIHSVFHEMDEGCHIISLGDAAETNALEFDDGKLILSELSTFSNLNWDKVKSQIPKDLLVEKTSNASLIGLVDWCNLPHASDIWQGFFLDVVQHHVDHKPEFFFDLADPSKKTAEEVRNVMRLINRFTAKGRVTLGLNENETIRLADFMGLEAEAPTGADRINLLGRKLFDALEIDQLVIHPIDGCFLFNDTYSHYLDGRVVDHPKVSTGGGDNFNSGFCFGMLNGFDQLQQMVLAMAASGAYVQNGVSPDLEMLQAYLSQWLGEL